jgi:hypothetical protein
MFQLSRRLAIVAVQSGDGLLQHPERLDEMLDPTDDA